MVEASQLPKTSIPLTLGQSKAVRQVRRLRALTQKWLLLYDLDDDYKEGEYYLVKSLGCFDKVIERYPVKPKSYKIVLDA